MKEDRDRFELTDGRLVGITPNNAASHYPMTREFQTVLESSGIEQTALRNHTPCMVHVIRLPLGEFKSSLRVQGRTKSWEAHERAQQSGENDSTEIGKSQRL